MNKTSDIRDISGVGDNLASKLNHLDVKTIDDLIHYFPVRYDDFSIITKANHLTPGQVTLQARITNISGNYLKGGRHMTRAIADDGTQRISLVWFNQSYRETSLVSTKEYFITGKYERRYGRMAIFNPIVEAVSDFPINTARIVPRYHQTKGLTSGDIRRTLAKITDIIALTPDSLPPEISKDYKLISLAAALYSIHFPDSTKDMEAARRRLGFEELFMMILASELNKKLYEKASAVEIPIDNQVAIDFTNKLPFKLTDDQKVAAWRIYKDMEKTSPMNRLVEGDVGSGKTAVAAMAALMVLNAGRQVVFMAPTELLARQHAETIRTMFKELRLEDRVDLLIGAMSEKAKAKVRKDVKDKKTMFVIGTHALIQEKVETPDLALVIIDEQHRFGVKQRQALKLKANVQPHMLSLSATPIPRSLALTLFGELDISRLVDKPKARQPIKTTLLSETMLIRQLDSIKEELKAGRQAFIVSSNIDTDPKYSVNEIHKWAEKTFKGYKVGLMHGRLKAEDKNHVMQQFIDKKLDILVSTTVIEVGIDVPNATVMLVFDAERFGLAQLHQLRGRVGRGKHPGTAILIYPDSSTPSDRLKALESSSDGFKLAELDLEIRGPGAIYDKFQHGQLDLRMAGLDDAQLIKEARTAAKYFVESGLNLLKYPQLEREVTKLQKLTNLN